MTSNSIIYNDVKGNFEKYIIPMYMELLYLRYMEKLLYQNLKNDEFLNSFQKENFSLLISYIMMLHDTIILSICKITDINKYDDDQNIQVFLQSFKKIFSTA